MNKVKRLLAFAITVTLLAGLCPVTQTTHAARKNPKLSVKSVTLFIGQSKKVSVKNTSKRVKWSLKSGKKVVKLSKIKKNSVVIQAKKKGKAKLQAKVGGKKLICTIRVNENTQKTTEKKATTTATQNSTSSNTITVATTTTQIATTTTAPVTTEEKKTTENPVTTKGQTTTEQPVDVPDKQPEVLPIPPEGAFYYAEDKIVLNKEYGNNYSEYGVREWSNFYNSYYYILPTCGVETEKEYVGRYGNADGTELVDYYIMDSKGIIYVKPTYYSYNQEQMKYEESESTEFADIDEHRKYISFRCCSAGGGMEKPSKGSLRYETSNEDVIYVHPGLDNYYQCYLLPVGEGTATISVYYNDILILNRTYSVGHYNYETQYSYKITDVSVSDIWYTHDGGRLIYVETDNPDPETFRLYSYGMELSTCRMYALNADIVWDEKLSVSYTATLKEKYNYYPSSDGKGYYIPIKSDVTGTTFLSVEENGHIVPNVYLKLECVSEYQEKLEEWYRYVEESAGVSKDMETLEKVQRVVFWLHSECYYPTMIYYNGKYTGCVYPDEPTWITPVFDCTTACYHLSQIIKDYEGIDSVVFDAHASVVTINGVEYTFNPTPDRYLKPTVYIESK